MLNTDEPQKASARPPAALPPQASNAANPRELYETAYGYLLQQDYGAAEVAFDEFLRRFPGDRLAGDAQYWLGETLYVQRRYKPAGQAFLSVIEKHKDSAKVPHSLLKLAQSLEQLGQKDCGIFAEIDRLRDRTPADVRVRARGLKQRQGC
ncbi:MAG: tol-pal system protein YbgF [Hyphomicrobiaceae bacterium]